MGFSKLLYYTYHEFQQTVRQLDSLHLNIEHLSKSSALVSTSLLWKILKYFLNLTIRFAIGVSN